MIQTSPSGGITGGNAHGIRIGMMAFRVLPIFSMTRIGRVLLLSMGLWCVGCKDEGGSRLTAVDKTRYKNLRVIERWALERVDAGKPIHSLPQDELEGRGLSMTIADIKYGDLHELYDIHLGPPLIIDERRSHSPTALGGKTLRMRLGHGIEFLE